MSNQAIGQELSRVRKLKRATESEVELLRSDMENGKIHLRVHGGLKFRQELAKKKIEIMQENNHSLVFCDPVAGIIYSCTSEFILPQNTKYRIVAIDDLFSEQIYDIYPLINNTSNKQMTCIAQNQHQYSLSSDYKLPAPKNIDELEMVNIAIASILDEIIISL